MSINVACVGRKEIHILQTVLNFKKGPQILCPLNFYRSFDECQLCYLKYKISFSTKENVFIESSILYENSRKSVSLQALKDILGDFGFFDLLEPYFFQPCSTVKSKLETWMVKDDDAMFVWFA